MAISIYSLPYNFSLFVFCLELVQNHFLHVSLSSQSDLNYFGAETVCFIFSFTLVSVSLDT